MAKKLPSSPAPLSALVERAREATTKLRDAAREGRVIEFRDRDKYVMAIHNALDAALRAAADKE